jgi:hypothetical protein
VKQHEQVAPRVKALAQRDTFTPTQQLLHSQWSNLDPKPTFEELCDMCAKWRVFSPLRCHVDFKEDLTIRPLFRLPNLLPPPSPLPTPKLAF